MQLVRGVLFFKPAGLAPLLCSTSSRWEIELAEPKALAGFDIGRFAPFIVCIEAHVEVRQEIISYFARHGYVVIGKYWLVDRWNMYFTPAAHAESITAPYVTRTGR